MDDFADAVNAVTDYVMDRFRREYRPAPHSKHWRVPKEKLTRIRFKYYPKEHPMTTLTAEQQIAVIRRAAMDNVYIKPHNDGIEVVFRIERGNGYDEYSTFDRAMMRLHLLYAAELCPAPPRWQDDKGWQEILAYCKKFHGTPCENCKGHSKKSKDNSLGCGVWFDGGADCSNWHPPINPSTITDDNPAGYPYATYAAWLADQSKSELIYDESDELTVAEYQESIRQIRLHLDMKDGDGMLQFIDSLVAREKGYKGDRAYWRDRCYELQEELRNRRPAAQGLPEITEPYDWQPAQHVSSTYDMDSGTKTVMLRFVGKQKPDYEEIMDRLEKK